MRLIARPQVDRRDRGTLLKLRLRPTHPPALLARQPLTPMRRLPRQCRRHCRRRMAVEEQPPSPPPQ